MLVWVDGVPARRLSVLVGGLPADAAVHRRDAFPPMVELLARLHEQQDRWNRALFAALRNQKRVMTPGEVRVLRPGEDGKPKIESDPRAIAAFFAANVGRGKSA